MCSLPIIGEFPSLMDLENRSASDSSMKGAPSLRRRPGMESGALDLVGSILYSSLKTSSAEMETEVIELRLYGSWALRSARALVSSLVNIEQKELLKMLAFSTSEFATWPRCTISGMMLFGSHVQCCLQVSRTSLDNPRYQTSQDCPGTSLQAGVI